MDHEVSERWCPRCREAAAQLETPQRPPFAEWDDHLSVATDPLGHRRKYRCQQCQMEWESVELPAAFVEALRASRKSLVDAQRRVAMLRLLLASERKHQAQNNSPADEAFTVRAA